MLQMIPAMGTISVRINATMGDIVSCRITSWSLSAIAAVPDSSLIAGQSRVFRSVSRHAHDKPRELKYLPGPVSLLDAKPDSYPGTIPVVVKGAKSIPIGSGRHFWFNSIRST